MFIKLDPFYVGMFRVRCEASRIIKPNNWHPDHIIPYAKGGATSVSNGQATCATCNLAKGAK